MRTMHTPKGPLELRELNHINEMIAAEEIQKRVWGVDVTPHTKEFLIPVQHEGGLLAGAFTMDQELVGLVFGFPTRDAQIQHSQLLASLPEWRGMGVGAQLKWFQRDWCLERGIRTVRWTVDPLRAVNAALNIGRLGAVSSTYYPDYYGAMKGIDAGAPSDRLLVEWHLDSARVKEHAAGTYTAPEISNLGTANEVDGDLPARPRLDLALPGVLVYLPDHFPQLAKDNISAAVAWRTQTRMLFQHYFSRGYQITGFRWKDHPAYLLTKP